MIELGQVPPNEPLALCWQNGMANRPSVLGGRGNQRDARAQLRVNGAVIDHQVKSIIFIRRRGPEPSFADTAHPVRRRAARGGRRMIGNNRNRI